MAQLVKEGKVRYLGLSEATPDTISTRSTSSCRTSDSTDLGESLSGFLYAAGEGSGAPSEDTAPCPQRARTNEMSSRWLGVRRERDVIR